MIIRNDFLKKKTLAVKQKFALIRPADFVLFVPGMILIMFGLTLGFAPQFVIPLFAAFLVISGVLAVFAARRLSVIKKKFEALARGLEGKIMIQKLDVNRSFDEELDHKKEYLH